MKPCPRLYRFPAASFPLSSLIISLILPTASVSCSPRAEESTTRPFGVVLSLETAKLWDEVETRYGRSVRTERAPELEIHAEAVVTDDGTPVIRIRESAAPTEVRIAHELLHLQMASEGFAVSIEPRFRLGSVSLENVALFRRTAEVVHNGVLHWMLYPKLRSMGMDPSEDFRGQLAETFFIRSAAADALTKQDLALNFFKASVEIEDPEFTAQLAAHYLENGWQESLETGRAMAEFVTGGRPDSPQRELDVFLACMDRLFDGTAAFSVLGQTTQLRGTIQVSLVTVSVGERR